MGAFKAFDFSDSKSGRPSAVRILAAWKREGCPGHFTVEYGETFAEFEWIPTQQRWIDTGNGCRGVDRQAVLKLVESHWRKITS